MKGKLFVVATPIGNLKDITLRAIETLKEVDIILCEDTRRALKLLNHYGIKKKLISYFKGKEEKRIPLVEKILKEGKNIALISDSGTPCIQDPGYILIKNLREKGYEVIPVPGVSSVTCALSVSGINSNNFLFLGFLPKRNSKRKKILKNACETKKTCVIFISPHEKEKVFPEIFEIFGNKKVYIGRELTKIFEEHFYGNLKDALEWIRDKRGEFVLIIEGNGKV
ncbi:MAG: 16S rRNA (cytidine(1402)-2'-O)-methyltransferase [candidate division WOR-3 bacterium]